MGLFQGRKHTFATRKSKCIIQIEPAQIQRPQQPPNNLTTLPVEILTEVMTHLGWRDVLRAREACKVLQEISTTRQIWENLLQEIISRSQIHTKLERPIELYSSKELEHLALQWTTANMAGPLLVEGGRWLLVANRAGRVTYYDLDEEEMKEKTLIPEQLGIQLEQLDKTSTLMDVDMDVDAHFLTFNLGLCFRRPDVSLLQIWSVRLELDSHGRGTGLKAEILASFPRILISWCIIFHCLGSTLRSQWHGEFVATSTLSSLIGLKRTHIVSCGKTKLYPKQLIYPVNNPGQIRLLPGRRLIITCGSSVCLYDLHFAHATRGNLPDSSPHMHTPYEWFARVGDLNPRSLSKPFHHTESGTIRLIAHSRNTIYGIIIPSIDADARDPENSPQVVTLMNYEVGVGDCYPSLGYNHAMFFRSSYVTTLNYSWPDDPEFKPPTTSCKLSSYKVCRVNGYDMDRLSGRVVFSWPGQEIFVLDMAISSGH
ncbi:hypothetical protein BDZ97DRAFT_2084948 [Flammula alnicola]|nr:hypothetical protein BDZ97DRAFT_2084948 [Flammula alnicola]